MSHSLRKAFLLRTVVVAISLTGLCALVGTAAADDARSNRWESAIRKFEEADEKSPPPPGGVLFVGSSSIRQWKLDESFPGQSYINRGFGGSQIVDSTHFADRIVLPYKPRAVVLYAGDNDIASGKSPDEVSKDFRLFVASVHNSLPKTRIIFIAIKPSIARWKLIDNIRAANRQIQEFTAKDARREFVELESHMLDRETKQPMPDLFVKDGLHLSPKGYEIWTGLVAPHLNEPQAN